mmetsp:Transcript_6122/g.18495  ORF Transcript_6122/g.18495 Transcript_6122/m.18495 type:complete len:266 (+) Transcript_6122:64-861(+)|eukprot:CAMPEP_0198733218 /NCGR_PEP_ID=MMETSP1475-20131203/43755_1 /TAXON_ID= ORGANISM="Unidentified sp., Strain CCMP1999" /NCGR_SAMPLE_ID=MMETSP1475 /ASSEMBLY_ACC=CAM_ASM_001111 /LENGTH=265 /DNA_ID=CAMNT_0044496477 /DNA_START=51 /DNA_END=848 /DNA_ORIENTATION=-
MAFVNSFWGVHTENRTATVQPRRRNGSAVAAGRRCTLRMQADDAEDEAPSDTSIPTSDEAEVFSRVRRTRFGLTTQLLELCAVTNRGQNATTDQKAQIDDIVATLEADNPNPSPVISEEIDGTWNLIYLSTPFYKASPLLAPTASPIFQVGQVRQIIAMDVGELINEVDVIAFPMITGTVQTIARVTPVGDERMELELEKATLKGGNAFERFDLGGLKIDIPVEDIYKRIKGTMPEAFIDTYYLDDKIRVSRGKDSKLFIFAKMQ